MILLFSTVLFLLQNRTHQNVNITDPFPRDATVLRKVIDGNHPWNQSLSRELYVVSYYFNGLIIKAIIHMT